MGIRLRCTVGRYAGQIRDYPFDVARRLLAAGTAVEPSDGVPHDEQERAVAPLPETTDASRAAAKPRKRGRPKKAKL